MLREVDIRLHNFLCFLTFRKSIVLVQLATLIYAIRSQTFIKDFLLRVKLVQHFHINLQRLEKLAMI